MDHDDRHAKPDDARRAAPRRVMRDTTAIYYQIVLIEQPDKEPQEWKKQAHYRAIQARKKRTQYVRERRRQQGVFTTQDELVAWSFESSNADRCQEGLPADAEQARHARARGWQQMHQATEWDRE